MRKKMLEYIIKEIRKQKKVISIIIYSTIEECNFLYKHKISVIKSRTKFIYELINIIELIDIFEFCREF